MSRTFNVTADCKPDLHYMVNISSRLAQIKGYVDRGEYFVINRARQYGETTTQENGENLELVEFLDFLAQIRGYYIDRDQSPTFQSVILAGVYDVKNLKRRFRPEAGTS